jgi:hypothetical protein
MDAFLDEIKRSVQFTRCFVCIHVTDRDQAEREARFTRHGMNKHSTR